MPMNKSNLFLTFKDENMGTSLKKSFPYETSLFEAIQNVDSNVVEIDFPKSELLKNVEISSDTSKDQFKISMNIKFVQNNNDLDSHNLFLLLKMNLIRETFWKYEKSLMEIFKVDEFAVIVDSDYTWNPDNLKLKYKYGVTFYFDDESVLLFFDLNLNAFEVKKLLTLKHFVSKVEKLGKIVHKIQNEFLG